MLILTRRANESISIGDDIVVTIIAVRGNQVRIGITAPRHVSVPREEVLRKIQKEAEESSRATAKVLAPSGG